MKQHRIIYIFSLIAACAIILCAAASAQNPPAPLSAGTPDTDAVSSAADNKETNWLDDDNEAKPPPVDSNVPSLGKMLVRLGAAMLVIIAVLGGGLFLMQKISRRKFGLSFSGKNRPLHIVDRLMIGSKTHVCLLRVYDRYLAIGVTEKEMSVLTEVVLPDDAENDATGTDFSGTLAQAAETNRAEASSDK